MVFVVSIHSIEPSKTGTESIIIVSESKEAIGEFEPMEKMSFSALGCDTFVEWVKAQGKKTILMIAHRPSTIQLADRVCCME